MCVIGELVKISYLGSRLVYPMAVELRSTLHIKEIPIIELALILTRDMPSGALG